MPFVDRSIRLERHREYSRQYRQRNQDVLREKNRVFMLFRHHGMRPEQWVQLLITQDGRCYLCERPLADGEGVIDHDHSCCPRLRSCPSCRRGISCTNCNPLIGYASDDPERLRLIAANLEKALAVMAEKRASRQVQDDLFASSDQEAS